MGVLSIRIPNSYPSMMKRISQKDKISINQFVNSAIAEKISALETADYLETRAKSGSRDKFLAVLSKVPD